MVRKYGKEHVKRIAMGFMGRDFVFIDQNLFEYTFFVVSMWSYLVRFCKIKLRMVLCLHFFLFHIK